MNVMRVLFATAFVIAGFSFNPAPASAGLLDRINQATQKLNDYNARQQGSQSAATYGANGNNGTDEDHPIQLQGQGHCHGQNTATCMDYMEVVDQCMDPIKGYRSKLYVDLIGKKLKEEKNLSAQERKNLEEDLAGFKEAYANKTDDPTIAGQKSSQRYLSDVTDEDQVYVNAEYGKLHQKIYNKCIGADHMQTGHRTEMGGGPTMSGDEAVAELKAQKAKERAPMEAARAQQKQQMQDMQQCMEGLKGVRWKIIADKIEAKMKTGAGILNRKEWDADLASLRDAEKNNLNQPVPADPNKPNRYLQRLNLDENMAVNNEYIAGMSELSNKCSSTMASNNGAATTSPRRRHP